MFFKELFGSCPKGKYILLLIILFAVGLLLSGCGEERKLTCDADRLERFYLECTKTGFTSNCWHRAKDIHCKPADTANCTSPIINKDIF